MVGSAADINKTAQTGQVLIFRDSGSGQPLQFAQPADGMAAVASAHFCRWLQAAAKGRPLGLAKDAA